MFYGLASSKQSIIGSFTPLSALLPPLSSPSGDDWARYGQVRLDQSDKRAGGPRANLGTTLTVTTDLHQCCCEGHHTTPHHTTPHHTTPHHTTLWVYVLPRNPYNDEVLIAESFLSLTTKGARIFFKSPINVKICPYLSNFSIQM